MRMNNGIHVKGKRIDSTWMWRVLDCTGKINVLVKICHTQKAAIVFARLEARYHRCELVVHGRDGRIRQKDSYGRDPRKVKG